MKSVDRIGVIGLRYVGFPVAIAFKQSGYDVVGVDVDGGRVKRLRKGESYVQDIENRSAAEAIERRFEPTTGYEALKEVDGVSIWVPTPLRKSGGNRMSHTS